MSGKISLERWHLSTGLWEVMEWGMRIFEGEHCRREQRWHRYWSENVSGLFKEASGARAEGETTRSRRRGRELKDLFWVRWKTSARTWHGEQYNLIFRRITVAALECRLLGGKGGRSFVLIQVGNYSSSKGGEKWSFSGCILKQEWTGLSERLCMGCEGKRN